MKTKLQNCRIYGEGLVQSRAGSLIVGSVSGSPYEPADPVGFFVVSLVPLHPTILPLPLPQDSPNST